MQKVYKPNWNRQLVTILTSLIIYQTAMPVRVMKLIGVENLIVTNAGGGLNNMFTVGKHKPCTAGLIARFAGW